jgi:branched-subunit amino acid transport protein AzlD
MTTTIWITVAALAVGTFASKAAGTLVLGSRELSPRTLAVTALLAPALLAGLLVYETFGGEDGFVVDARAAGLSAAILAILAKAPMFLVIVVAALTAALVRLFT